MLKYSFNLVPSSKQDFIPLKFMRISIFFIIVLSSTAVLVQWFEIQLEGSLGSIRSRIKQDVNHENNAFSFDDVNLRTGWPYIMDNLTGSETAPISSVFVLFAFTLSAAYTSYLYMCDTPLLILAPYMRLRLLINLDYFIYTILYVYSWYSASKFIAK